MKNILFLLLSLVIFLTACKTTKEISSDNSNILDPINVVGKKSAYKGTPLQLFDIIHTKLDVKFSWEEQYLFGEEIITLKPYFYPQNSLELDAKGMDIKRVAIFVSDDKVEDLPFTYDDKILKIDLNATYTRDDVLDIYIKYVAKPEELEKTEELAAIKDRKGLYFINPLGEIKDKPRQIWTQGEPESNSVWFPTIDHPSERFSEQISITIENNFTAMSNGFIESNVDNGDGTYTITWNQEKPIAPYLVMIAIGEYAEVKDYWRGMEVNYYVEKEYENVARDIFGKTPEMLEFFSNKLGIEYPWDKYWQVVVRDYVSGAMENTTAVVFGEFMQRDKRELLDENHEDIVAHELFHHWFGDLVTCESWSNLPLNESFATYGEVLWDEYKYGEDAKYLKLKKDRDNYFREAKSGKQVDLIRFNYDKPEDMFDRHSYEKGGLVLNMLREVVGDDAFFTSLQNYLWTNRFQSVEIHDLRLAFEETTGQDLNWFFNQWFLSSGHPIIDVNYTYSDSSVIVKLNQKPSNEEYLIYTIPMAIDITEGYNTRTENIIFDKKSQTFEFFTTLKPSLVNVDAKGHLLAEIIDSKTEENYVVQFNRAKNLMDKVEVLEYFSNLETKTLAANQTFSKALSDKYWYVQKMALKMMDSENIDALDVTKIVNIAENGEKPSVQAEAMYLLAKLEDTKHENTFEKGLRSMSYRVNAGALNGMLSVNEQRAIEVATEWEHIENYDIIDEIGHVYSEKGDTSKKVYFQNLASNSTDEYSKYYAITYYSKYLRKMDEKTVLEGITFIENWGVTDKGSYSNIVATNAFTRISNSYVIKADSYKNEIKNSVGLTNGQVDAMENEYANILLVLDRIENAKKSLEATKNADK